MEGGLGLHLRSAVKWRDENKQTDEDIVEGERRRMRNKRVSTGRGNKRTGSRMEVEHVVT